MQFKTPESALHAKSQESSQMSKSYSTPSAGSNGQDLAKSPVISTVADALSASGLPAQIGERLTAARQTAEEMSRTLMDRARKSATATDSYVHAQPWKAIAIGAAAGVLLGLLFARRA
jgi:ElaB/YqjD/DUF883 family membrane-anchored ribosome-binding protein